MKNQSDKNSFDDNFIINKPESSKRIIINNTEGNEAVNPDVGNSETPSDRSANLLQNDGLASEFEPYGSQRFQYNG